VEFDLDPVGKMPAGLVNEDMPAGHEEQAVVAPEEKPACAGENLSLPNVESRADVSSRARPTILVMLAPGSAAAAGSPGRFSCPAIGLGSFLDGEQARFGGARS